MFWVTSGINFYQASLDSLIKRKKRNLQKTDTAPFKFQSKNPSWLKSVSSCVHRPGPGLSNCPLTQIPWTSFTLWLCQEKGHEVKFKLCKKKYLKNPLQIILYVHIGNPIGWHGKEKPLPKDHPLESHPHAWNTNNVRFALWVQTYTLSPDVFTWTTVF